MRHPRFNPYAAPNGPKLSIRFLVLEPNGLMQPSPGQSEAPPWVSDVLLTEPCKGGTKRCPIAIAPFQGWFDYLYLVPRAALRSAPGFHIRVLQTQNRNIQGLT